MIFFKFHRISAFFVLLSTIGIFAQNPSVCYNRIDCSSCLQQSGCVWCMQPKPKNPLIRQEDLNHCIPRDSQVITCTKSDLVDPETGARIIQDQELKSDKGSVVQIKPQKINLTLRVGQTVSVKFQYSQAKNFPVDLYYIIDNSASMNTHKDKLANLGNLLGETMTKLTSDFRIGFGSFIEKQAGPFVSQVPSRKSPCKGCIPAYGFKNHLPLTPDFSRFSAAVRNLTSSGNDDTPEAGFDAIMQAILCRDEIKWRPQVRHIIIFSSDATFHIAGDGKLIGIVEPNDGQCHMIDNAYDGLKNDYPSVSQLNQVVKENNVNLIFAIVNSKKTATRDYKMLSRNIVNSKIGGLDEDSKNVVKLVVDNFKEIVGSVTLTANSTKNIQVKITPECKHPIRNGCAKVASGETLGFTASITLLECAENSSVPTFISIKPDGLNETLLLETRTICGCGCESPEDPSYKKNSDKCGGSEDLVCGLCVCKNGKSCECNTTSPTSSNETGCRDVEAGSKICSGRGKCSCGKCVCDVNPNTGAPYRQKFCECDDASCEMNQGKLCNDKGTCNCGECICNVGWTGESCACQVQDELCVKSGETEVCSGKGKCECGECLCSKNYTGSFCEVCPNCDRGCNMLKLCVECTVFGTGISDRSRCRRECVTYDIKSTVEPVVENKGKEETICRELDHDKCQITFKYMYDEDQKLTVVVQKNKTCPPNILVWVIAVAGLVLLVGFITLLIWKIATILHDKREYAKFVNEQQNSRWQRGENPLYKKATTTFRNPVYDQ